MRSIFLLFLLALLPALVPAQLGLGIDLGVTLSLGSSVSLQGGVQSSFNFGDSCNLQVFAASSCSLTVGAQAEVPATVPQGFTALRVGGDVFNYGHVGYVVSTNTPVSLSGQLTTEAVSDETAALISSGNTAACLKSSGGVYSRATVTSYDSVNKRLTVAVNGAGSYVVTAAAPSVRAQLGVPYSCIASQNQRLDFGSGVSIAFNSAAANSVTCTKSTTHTAASALAQVGTPVNVYLQSSLQDTTAAHSSVIAYTYTPAEVSAAGVSNAANLRLAAYDSSSGRWVVPTSGCTVDTANGIVSQAVTKFGVHALVEVLQALGVAVNVQSGSTTLSFQGGSQVVVQTTAPVTVSQSVVTSVPATLPQGFTALGLVSSTSSSTATHVGYLPSCSDNSKLSSARVVSAKVSSAGQTALQSGAVSCLQYHNGAYERVAVEAYDSVNQKAAVTLSGSKATAGHLIFTAAAPVVNGALNTPYPCIANQNQKINFGSGVAVQFNSAAANTLTCAKSSTHAAASLASHIGTSAGVYITPTLSQATAAHSSVVSYTYTDAELAAKGISDASRLRFAVYDAASSSWSVPSSGCTVNTATRTVSQATTSFKPCGVYAI
jgi:hypothetical protein